MDSAVDLVMDQWSIAHGQSGVSHPIGPSAAKQHEWDKPSIAADLASLMSSLPDRHHQVVYSQFQLVTVVTGCTRYSFHLVVCDWMTKLSELLLFCDLEPNFVSLISVYVAPRSTRKAHMVSPAEAVPAE